MRRVYYPQIILLIIGVLGLSFLSTCIMKHYSDEEIEIDIFNPMFNLSQDNHYVLEYVRKNHLFPPPSSGERIPIKTENYSLFRTYSEELTKTLFEFKQDRKGFFIECGANDGEFFSNTIGLEALKNWTGLLIEASPSLFKKLRSRQRNAWLSNVCLSGHHPEKLEFLKTKAAFPQWITGNGKIAPGPKKKEYNSEGMVDCVPFYSVLAAMGVSNVDFFSLDVEGHEYNILEAVPFDKINIDVILVEHWLAPQGSQAIKNLIISKGYSLTFENESDFIFKKNST